MSILEVLHTYFGYDSFRPLQQQIIQSVMDGNDTLALLPTGGGKSLCFQIPALAMASVAGTEEEKSKGGWGLCLVVTPLIALMKDQVENLQRRGIHAAAIYTGMSKEKQDTALDNCQYGPYRFLYVSPERLESAAFRNRLSYLPVNLIAVDEAHCISQWGYDFRPAYLRIAQVREVLAPSPFNGKQPPVLALTATATREVAEDIKDKLRHPLESDESPHKWQTFRQSFLRHELSFVVRYARDETEKADRLVYILQRVSGSAIVYVRNRKRAEQLAELLVENNINATFYHAGLTAAEREERQQEWKQYAPNQAKGKRVMVCTNAFGMGIDKADVRIVVHFDTPDSPEAYFQEAGRAGRDGQTAYAVLLYAKDDKQKLQKRVLDNYPPKEFIQKVYQRLSEYLTIGAGSGQGHTFNIQVEELCQVMHLPIIPTYSALRLLDQAGYIYFEEEHETQPRIQLRVSARELNTYILSREQHSLLQHLMRQYPGVFTELQYLHETMTDRLHQLLVSLAQRHIITYIPRSTASLVYFRQERQETVWLPPAVYEQRNILFQQRLQAMTDYATQNTQCRQQRLLAYFGETDSPPCGMCDICRQTAPIVT